jgi:hypothetical protein
MPPNTVTFEFDEKRNILFTEDHFELNGPQDIDEFIKVNIDELERLGRRVYVISKIDDLHIRADVTDYYGQRARGVFEKYVIAFARYGENPLSRMSVRTSARKSKLESNIYNTRQEAIAAIEKLKQQQEGGAS